MCTCTEIVDFWHAETKFLPNSESLLHSKAELLMTQRKGRPPSSQIRENMIELLHCLGSAYGYQISKVYKQMFAPATRRVIYYHLRKGIELGVFEIDEVKHEQGQFSWGTVAEKTYYKLGKSAQPRGDPRVRQVVDELSKKE